MSFEIRVNGQPFKLWETAVVTRSIDTNAGAFRFTNSSTVPGSPYPVKAGDFVEILIESQRKITGFVDQIAGTHDVGTHTITVSGRDYTSDLIDSSVPDAGKVSDGPITLKALCEKVIQSLGLVLKVEVQVDDLEEFTSEDLQAAGSGTGCMDYLVSFARKRQVYLVPSGDGKLLIFRPQLSDKATSPLLHKVNGKTNNVVAYSVLRSQQNRFNRYLCRSQDNFGFSLDADYSGDGTDRKSEVTDSQIRASRYIEIQAEESMNDSECKERAAEEANIRRAYGLEYSASVAGTTQADGTLWDFGQFVDIDDDSAEINGTFLIKTVEYAIDIQQGSKTKLVCVPPDAYQVEAEPSAQDARKSSTGTSFQETTPPEVPNSIR